MRNWRSVLKAGIALFCEGVWLYFGLALFARIQWDMIVWPHPLPWIILPIAAYLLNYWLGSKTIRLLWIFLVNFILLLFTLVLQWTSIPAEQLSYAFTLGVALSYLYIRSCLFVYTEPSRAQMLLRFEGTIIFYVLLILFTQIEPFFSLAFHVFFFLAFMLSLLGMVLTLYSFGDEEDEMETRSVGEATFLPLIMGAFLIFTIVISLLFLIPAVRMGFISTLSTIWEGGVWAASSIFSVFVWLLSLIPPPEPTEMNVPNPAPASPIPGEIEQQQEIEFPVFWMMAILIVLVLLAFLWFSSFMIQRWKPSARVRIQRSKLSTDPFWKKIWQHLLAFLKALLQKWKMRFPHYFALQTYWYFHQVSRWGKKQGCIRTAQETPKEYMRRMVENISVPNELKIYFYKLGDSYSAAYYSGGQIIIDEDFSPLLDYVKTYRKWK